jgi:hypothetical protein
VDALEALTGRSDVRYATFTPWAHVVNVTPLLRRDKAWCPRCLAEWHRTGSVLYEPLVWAVEVVERCTHHGVPLVSQCPFTDCQARCSPVSERSHPGYCGVCARWLGTDHEDREVFQTGDADLADVVAWFVAHSVDAPRRLDRRLTRPVTTWHACRTLMKQLGDKRP